MILVEDEMRKNIIKKSVLIGILFTFIGIILTILFQRQITKENKFYRARTAGRTNKKWTEYIIAWSLKHMKHCRYRWGNCGLWKGI